MRIYLDNCCFNRPFDDQSQLRVRLEAEAKLGIQTQIEQGMHELVWSYILAYENEANPFDERKMAIRDWQRKSARDIEESETVIEQAKALAGRGVKSKDALHVACALEAGCQYFITTDDDVLERLCDIEEIKVVSPLEFIARNRP